jgi:hypothetical protein
MDFISIYLCLSAPKMMLLLSFGIYWYQDIAERFVWLDWVFQQATKAGPNLVNLIPSLNHHLFSYCPST